MVANANSALPLEGKTAIVTGGSQGIGKAIAHRLAEQGAAITIVGRNAQALEEARSVSPDRIAAHVGDAIEESVAEETVAAVIAEHGRLDMLVNNIGGAIKMGRLLDLGPEHFERTVTFNLRTPYLWSRAAWNAGMSEYGGAILNISSVGGFNVPAKMGAYSISKAGLNQMTRVLAAELSPKVRVNGLAPGLTRSESTIGFADRPELVRKLIPLERVGEPSDMAEAALFLLGEGASWITGETLIVDGGTLVETGRVRRSDEGENA